MEDIGQNGEWNGEDRKAFKTVTDKATGKKYGMEINIDKSQVMRVSNRNVSLRIIVDNRELKEVDHFKYLEVC